MDSIVINRITDGRILIDKLMNGKNNVIFGAGSIGSLIKDALDNLNVDIYSFLVNDGQKNNETYKNIRTYELSEFPLEEKDCNIIYSVQSDSLNILQPLIEIMKDNIIYTNGMKTIFSLLNIYYENYFESQNIDISKDVINFNGIKIINPFKLDEDCLNAFLFEIGDLILPNIMNDFTKVNEGPYEHGNVILKEGDIVFDCGANIGLFSAISASKNCKTYAFEPVPNTVKDLERMCKLYPHLIEVCKYALSSSIGETKFYISNDTNISSSILEKNQNVKNFINVNMTTIDEFVKENKIDRVDFIKADIEGAEREMLIGAIETLKKFAPKLSICTYHLEDDPEVLEKIIKEANPKYKIEHKWKKLYAYIS